MSLLFLGLIFAMVRASAADFETAFRAGLAAHQTKDYAKAREHFAEALAQQPGNTAAMTNYAIASYELGERGAAIGWFRRVLAVDPDQAEAQQGLQFALAQLPVKEIPHRIETYETLRNSMLQKAPARVFLGLTALLLLTAGWTLLTWIGRRKRSAGQDESPPPFPPAVGLISIAAGAAVLLTAVKLYDLSLPRGTIVVKQVPALSAPSETGATLFELHEGFEVVIQELTTEWAQVTYPGGLTGWIPKKALLSAGSAP